MKRWIHASGDAKDGWKKEWDNDLGESYYIREKNGLKAIISWKDNDGDGYYWARVFKPGQSGFVADKTFRRLDPAKEWSDSILDDNSEVKSSTKVTAAYDEDSEVEYLSYEEAMEDDDFFDAVDNVVADLGLYLDFSSIRGDEGSVIVFSDPDQECDSDMWDGDEDALITELDFSDYKDGVENEVLSYPREEWEARFKKYMEGQIS